METIQQLGAVKAFHHGKKVLGLFPPYMTVRCYAIDGLLIDTGLSFATKSLAQFVEQEKIKSGIITHHHEDHSGNAKFLQSREIKISASSLTREKIQQGWRLHFYQKLIWAPAPTTTIEVVSNVVETNKYKFEVIAAPGHCEDQVVFYEREQGWLFTGDAFIAQRIKYFRGDEDFHKTLASLNLLSQLKFDHLYCAHHPVMHKGLKALIAKKEYLENIKGQALYLYNQGLTLREITTKILGKEKRSLYFITAGDLSKINMIRSIIKGPVARRS